MQEPLAWQDSFALRTCVQHRYADVPFRSCMLVRGADRWFVRWREGLRDGVPATRPPASWRTRGRREEPQPVAARRSHLRPARGLEAGPGWDRQEEPFERPGSTAPRCRPVRWAGRDPRRRQGVTPHGTPHPWSSPYHLRVEVGLLSGLRRDFRAGTSPDPGSEAGALDPNRAARARITALADDPQVVVCIPWIR